MDVSLKAFKEAVVKTKIAIKAETINLSEFIELKADSNRLWVGGRSAAISYCRAVEYTGRSTFRTIYLPLSVSDALPKATKDDVLTLDLEGTDLLFSSSSGQGMVGTVTGLQYSAPFITKEQAGMFCTLRSGQWVKNAIKLASHVKKGWTSKTKPYIAGFIRLAVAEEEDIEAVILLGLSAVSHDQDHALGYQSGMALSIFASDGTRYYQSFEPVYIAQPSELVHALAVSSVVGRTVLGTSLHLTLKDAEFLARVIEDEEYRIGLITNENGDPDALVLFNNTSVIWVRLALDVYPDEDINQQLMFFKGDVVAEITPTGSFIDSVKAAEKIPATRKHGLTVRLENDILRISSPEDASTVRFDSIAARTVGEPATVFVDGAGFLSALSANEPLKVVLGEDFLAIYNMIQHTRVILRKFVR